MIPRRIVVISDFQDGPWSDARLPPLQEFKSQWASGTRGGPSSKVREITRVEVEGGYLERLPLAAVKDGMVDCAEIWTHWRGATPPVDSISNNSSVLRRSFRMNGPEAPFSSNDMLGHIEAYGPPDILCVWGLGVDEDIMLACRSSFKIYNSIDAPALRVPENVSRHFDLVITGAQWQSDVVQSRHPRMRTVIMPIGPEFASDLTFRPLDIPKVYDVIYVAAAQAYKRHDILFESLVKLPRSLRALCVFGYGEMASDLRNQADALGLNVDFVGPPGVPFEQVNELMNRARIGVVCGIDDGAPAILTEYMLAGIPVLANSALSCGLQYITPETGASASAENFHEGICKLLERSSTLRPRDTVLKKWTWPHSIQCLRNIIEAR